MWFLFGFITLILFSASALYFRFYARWSGDVFRIEEGPYEVKVSRRKGHGRITGFRIGIDGVPEYDLMLKKEGPIDRFFKHLNFSSEWQTGDRTFDEQIYIACDSSDIHKLLARQPELRKAVLQLFSHAQRLGFRVKRIHNRAGRLWVELSPPDTDEPHTLADAFAHELYVIKRVLETFRHPRNRLRDPFVLKAIVILAISSGLAINGAVHVARINFSHFPMLTDSHALIWAALPYALLLAGLLAALTLFLLNGSSRTHLVLVEVLLVGLCGSWATAFMELRDINIEMDESAAIQHETKVTTTRKHVSTGSKGRRQISYYVTLQSLPYPAKSTELRVSGCFYRSVSFGTDVILTAREGYLGYPWYEDLQRKNSRQDC